jgi:sugar O-acyltransferase (sialic acid O-acetyltransferase NeuD family)
MGNSVVTQENGVRALLAGERHAAGLRTLPADVCRILIVGAGGFGREVLTWARDTWSADSDKLIGFLSADRNVLDGRVCDLPILGDPADFAPSTGDAFLLAIGIPHVRRRVAEILESRGARFLSLVHPTAIVAPTASVGSGSIVCPFAIVSDASRIGPFALLNYGSSVGHDAVVGTFGVLSPYAAIAGNAELGLDGFMGLHASLGPGCRVGASSKISANSCALSDAPAQSLIFGVPGRASPLLRPESP